MPENKEGKVNPYAGFLDTVEGPYFQKYQFIKYNYIPVNMVRQFRKL